MMEINIGGRLIGKNHPCYLIAEVGTTCMGDLGKVTLKNIMELRQIS